MGDPQAEQCATTMQTFACAGEGEVVRCRTNSVTDTALKGVYSVRAAVVERLRLAQGLDEELERQLLVRGALWEATVALPGRRVVLSTYDWAS